MADQLAFFTPAEDAAMSARSRAGEYLSRAIWRDLWDAGRQHGLAGGRTLERNKHGAAMPTDAARAILRAYFTTTAHIEAPMNRHDADLFEAGRRFGATERRARRRDA